MEENYIDENLLYPEANYKEAYYSRSMYLFPFLAGLISGLFGIFIPLFLMYLDLTIPEGQSKPNLPLWSYICFLPFTYISLSYFYKIIKGKSDYKNIDKKGKEIIGVVYYRDEYGAYIKVPTSNGDRTIICYDPITQHAKYSVNQELRILIYKNYYKIVD